MYSPNACGVASLEPSPVPSANGSLPGPLLAEPELGGQVTDQRGRRYHLAGTGLPHRLEKLGLPDRAGVVEVQRVAPGLVALRQVGLRPVRGHGQVGLHPGGRPAERLLRERDLRGAPEHVALPFGARVEVVRVHRHERADVAGLGHGVDAAGQRQQVLGARRVLLRRQLGAEGVVGREPAGEVGADPRPRRGRLEDRPVFHVVGGGAGMAALADVHAVLGLRQEPEVVVALDRVARVAGADSDLDVHHLGRRVPQLLQVAEPEAGLGRQRRVGAGEVAGGEQHQPVGVAAGIGELLVAAAGVEPAAGHVNRPADPVQLAEQVVVAVVAG